MNDLAPRQPKRPLLWPDVMLDLQALLADTSEPVYVVGGAVRDAYLHRPLKDIDLTTPGNAVQLARRIANTLNGDFFVLDDARDVGRSLVDTPDGRLVIDVTHFRGADLLADLFDRDFTVNAMAVDVRDMTRLIDPLGGEQDVEARLVRRCSAHAIADDPVRALRAVRQSVQFGMRIEAETLHDIRTYGTRLVETSPERVRDEFVKLLSLDNCASALRIADRVGLLEIIIPEVEKLHQPQEDGSDLWQQTLVIIERLSNIMAAASYTRSDNTAASFGIGMMAIQLDHFRASLQSHFQTLWPNERPHWALLNLAILLHQTPESADVRADALRLSSAEKERLMAVVRNLSRLSQFANPTRREIYRFWCDLGSAGVDICLLALAHYLGRAGVELDQRYWLELVERVRLLLEAYYERYEEVVAPPPLLDGNDLMAKLGLRPGPIIGELLELIRESQAAGEVHSAEEALQLAQTHLDHHK
jgi:tRNA nucleotidyltransferase/poly(A) polymerase